MNGKQIEQNNFWLSSNFFTFVNIRIRLLEFFFFHCVYIY